MLFKFAANVHDYATRVPPLPAVELHAFAVVYVRFANVYHIHTAVWRPGAF
jgi:hypothetical protein